MFDFYPQVWRLKPFLDTTSLTIQLRETKNTQETVTWLMLRNNDLRWEHGVLYRVKWLNLMHKFYSLDWYRDNKRDYGIDGYNQMNSPNSHGSHFPITSLFGQWAVILMYCRVTGGLSHKCTTYFDWSADAVAPLQSKSAEEFLQILSYRENTIIAKIAHKIVDYSVKISNFPIEQENMKMLKCFYVDEAKFWRVCN